MNTKKELEEAIEREVSEWPGATVEFIQGGKHPKAKLKFDGRMLSTSYPSTSGSARIFLHTLGDVRRTLRKLGAERPRPEPSTADEEKEYRKANEGAAKRPSPVAAERAEPQPSMADQLVAQQAAGSAETYRMRQEVTNARPPARVISVPDEDQTDEDAEREARRAEFQNRVEAIVDGIYFGLDAEVYHAVPALGSGSLCDLLVSPGTFWRGSWLDPDRPELDEEATKAQILGRAYHAARLEPEEFEKRFCREPSKDDYPARGMLTSDAAVKQALKEEGQTQALAGETSRERAERLEDLGYPGTIWPLEYARWQETVKGRQPIPAKYWEDIEIDMARLKATPDVHDLLVGGETEVSVFWHDKHNLRCKCRFDYLRPRDWADFKTFDNSRRMAVDQAISNAIRYNRYYVQAAHYRDGWDAIASGGLEIQGEATDRQRLLVGTILEGQPPACWYIFQEKGRVPNLLAKRFLFGALDTYRDHEIKAMLEDPNAQALVRDALAQETQIYRRGKIEIERAKMLFNTYSQVYQPGEPWAPLEPMGTISDNDFNQYWLEGKQ